MINKAKSMLQNEALKPQFNRKRKLQMERSQQFETTSICSELNLKIQDLNIEQLLANTTYRRLYNIVINDTNKTEYQYRKNLIKQLYFLLKITPIMKPELQQSYLHKLQNWYNSNDHKKTELGSGKLKNIMNEYESSKESFSHYNKESQQRPQSSVNWNKNVPSFLRPYTAKRPNNSQNRSDSHKSKFAQSTKASTILQSTSQIALRDFALSIQQEFEISRDFIRKNRTIHPESEPIYEQLFAILKKAEICQKFTKNDQEDAENEILFQRDKSQFFAEPLENQVKQKPVEQKINLQKEQVNFNSENDDFQKVSEESEKDEDDEKEKEESEEEQKIFERKIYTRDQNVTKDDIKTIDGFFHLHNENQRDTFLLKKANNKYLHLTNNKFVNDSKHDHETIRNLLDYSRVKSAMKKQFSRKSQSKRLLSAKARSTTNLSVTANKNPRIHSAMPKRDRNFDARKTEKSQSFNAHGANVFDFSNFEGNKENSNTFFISSPVYNQRKELDKLYRKPIENYKKFNKNNILQSEIMCNDKQFLTKYDCFLTRQKINPIADIHVEQHNEEALEQIQKIKQKVAGIGKKCISTESLMKALYIDSYDDIGCTMDYPVQNKVAEAFDWKNRNVYFNMLSNGQKKMKKKTRKLKKK